MCGILVVFNSNIDFTKIQNASKKLNHRGPDYHNIIQYKNHVFCHNRLSIVGLHNGAQPIEYGDWILVVNGEIYNHKILRELYCPEIDFKTDSDCEIIIHLYQYFQNIDSLMKMLDGVYAFVLYNKKTDEYIIARDPIGVNPLYINNGILAISSEMKALYELGMKNIEIFEPGVYKTKTIEKKFFQLPISTTEKLNSSLIYNMLETAVKKRLMCDVPFGVLLSGGLDSSIIATLVTKKSNEQIHTFSIGMENSPDLYYAKKVSDYLGTIHHEYIFTKDDIINHLSDVIYHIETYDITTVRASIPMYILAKEIHKLGIKMVLSGEGADELFAGYLYNKYAPNPEELHLELKDKVTRLHMYDCLRANKSMASSSIEIRVPFLDISFVEYIMGIDPKHKMHNRIEKYILRNAFEGLLPNDVLYRIKEQFSDGVGTSHIQTLKDYAENVITDDDFIYNYNKPYTKEHCLYRKIFESHFGSNDKTVPHDKSVACSTEKALKWKKEWEQTFDPSGHF